MYDDAHLSKYLGQLVTDNVLLGNKSATGFSCLGVVVDFVSKNYDLK